MDVMPKLPYFVKRRDETGRNVSTLCDTAEQATHKVDDLRLQGVEAGIEDGRPVGFRNGKSSANNAGDGGGDIAMPAFKTT
jgi:hypothetical protein